MPNSGPNGEWLVYGPERWASFPEVLEFKIWYADGSVYVGSPSLWDTLPREGVLFVIAFHSLNPPHRSMWAGADEYMLPGAETSKLGLQVSDEQMDAVAKAALHDCEWF